ncbi:MAG: trehalose-phosphatase [Candidatus Binataceae bacterium]
MPARGRILVCLDYDGTISAITTDLYDARPVAGGREVIAQLAAHPERVTLAVISGRKISDVRRLLGVERGVLFAGVHGLEILKPDGAVIVSHEAEMALDDLAKVRRWLAGAVSEEDGYVVEDKDVAIAFHYRIPGPERARGVRERLSECVEREAPGLRIMQGKMIDEILPAHGGGKADALRFVMESSGVSRANSAYFGDDTTDEDAFGELGTEGLTVLVGAARPSLARFRVDSPEEVVKELASLADVAATSPAH